MGKTLRKIGLNLVLAAVTLGTFNVILLGVEAAFAIAAVVAISVVQVQRAKARARKAANAATQSGLKEEIRSPKSPRTWVTGRARIAGTIVYAGTHGADNKFLTMVMVVASRPIHSFETWFVGDVAVTLDGSGIVTSGRYAGKVKILTKLGDHSTALALDPAEWTADHKCLGLAHFGVRYEWDPEVFTNGRPRVSCVIKGSPLYDPRLDSTVSGGSGAHRDDDPSTWEWSNNWALGMLDYLKDAPLGCRVPIAEVPVAFIMTAANVSDEAVTLNAGGSHPRYTMDGQLSSIAIREDNIASILPSGAGELVWQNGGYEVYAGVATTAVVDLGETDLRGPVSIDTKLPPEVRINRVVGRFIDPAGGLYEVNDYPAWVSSAAETEDGGEVFEFSLDLPFTQDGIRAQRIAKIFFEEARLQMTVQYPAKLKAWQLQVWSTMKLNNTQWSFIDKQFRVMAWSIAQDGGIDLELREYSASIYAWDETTDEGAVQAPAVPTLTDGTTAAAVADLVVTPVVQTKDNSTMPGFEVTWTAPEKLTSTTELQFKISTDSLWEPGPVVVDPQNPRVFIPRLLSGESYDIRVRHKTQFCVFGAWSTDTGNIAGVNTTDFATEVGGAEKPEDNATQNTGALADKDTVAAGDIDTDAVTTIKVLDAAISKISIGTNGSPINIFDDDTWTDIVSISFTKDEDGSDISLTGIVRSTQSGTKTTGHVRLLRDAVVLKLLIMSYTNATDRTDTLIAVDSPAAATYTYKLQVQRKPSGGGTVSIKAGEGNFSIAELKK